MCEEDVSSKEVDKVESQEERHETAHKLQGLRNIKSHPKDALVRYLKGQLLLPQ